MLLSLKKIYGIGKYAHFDGNVELSKNQVFFGFNGSGKSTLSDIFYSLSDEEHCNRLMERKTLQKENGDLPENPQIKIETSDGMFWIQSGIITKIYMYLMISILQIM